MRMGSASSVKRANHRYSVPATSLPRHPETVAHVEPCRGVAEMHVQRQGAEPFGGLSSERLEQAAADATPSSVLPDCHRYLREGLAPLVGEQRGLVNLLQTGARPLLEIVGCHELQLRKSRPQPNPRLVV